ncbi:hypothetical protein WJX81_008232 [Elliptochloris bilobata]|uniref:Peptidase S9 prolyl oligopeptidase catalytic domain-containing protein n=1 Tax=Elliptochloris bilobata TaxID=381761 RepID=A0AAW1SCN8_9CHLO
MIAFPVSAFEKNCVASFRTRRGERPMSRAAAQDNMNVAPVGEWVSPITSELITASSISLGAPRLAPSGDYVYYVEGRPTDKGRQVLCRQPVDGGAAQDVTPGPEFGFNVRTRVHEYGGGEYVLSSDAVYFSNFKDQQLYKQSLGAEVGAPEQLTRVAGHRFADAAVDERRGRLLAVREDHTGAGEAVNAVVAVSLATGESSVLASGADFYSNPRLSPDGSKLTWVQWTHPNMPWDTTELWVADVAADGSLTGQRRVAGGGEESVIVPAWAPDGALLFVSDRSGWWNLYRDAAQGGAVALCAREAEFGGPAWTFDGRPFQLLPDGRMLVTYSDPKEAGMRLAVLDPSDGSLADLDTPYTAFGPLSVVPRPGGCVAVALVGGQPTAPSEAALLEVPLEELATAPASAWRVLRKSSSVEVPGGYLSRPQPIEYPTTNNATSHMYYYPPANQDYELPPGEQPPLLVKIHGGPTSAAGSSFSLGIQYWTSRGFAVADVNYRGSTGYGRAYRNELRKQWGVADVDDCCAAAQYLAKQGSADAKRLCIDGGSAGGYTTLACLAFRKVFSAGASHYGVADCELLAKETHKFESRYLDSLIGPYPEDKAVYQERSPINALDRFNTPVAFFQGDEDEVVPPNQAVEMFEALKGKGVATALVMFKGEQHGFRSAGAIRRALDGELFFYGKAHTLTLFYLAQVHGQLGHQQDAVAYCAATLARQVVQGFPRLELVRNCVRLAGVYTDEGDFAVTQHLLAAADAVARQAAVAEEPIGEEATARLAQAWGYLYTQRLQVSAQRADANGGAPAQLPPGRLLALPDDLRLPTLGLPDPTTLPWGAAALATDFEGARDLFNTAMRHFRAALAGLPLDGEVTAHVDTLLHISSAYSSLAAFEQDPARRNAMQLQRARRLEAVIPQLNLAHYRTQLLALRSEAGAAHRAIMDAGFAERKPYPKVAAAAQDALQHYEGFLDFFRKDGRLPEQVPTEDAHLLSKCFEAARCLHRLQPPDARTPDGMDTRHPERLLHMYRDGVDTSYLERSLRMYWYILRQVADGRQPRHAYMAEPCAEMETMLVEQIDVARLKARRAGALR